MMLSTGRLVFLITLLTSNVQAQKVGLKSELGFACWNAAFKYNFGCPMELPYNDRCASDEFLATVFECINTYGTCTQKVEAAYQYVHDQCHYWGNRTISSDDMKQIYLDNADTIKLEDQVSGSGPLNHGVHVSLSTFSEQLACARTTMAHYALGVTFGRALLVYWCVVMGVATIINIWKLVEREYLNNLLGRRLTCWYRYWFSLPALCGYKHYTPHRVFGVFSITPPTRGQSLIIFGFVIINIVSLLFRWEIDGPFPASFLQAPHKVMRYMANRTGLIALQLLPITVLFACRNNPLIVLTGWNYQTFQLYHRWCARMMALHGVVHGTLITIYSCREGIALWKWRNVFNWPAGNTSAYAMVLMLVFSIKAVRRRAYELFLLIHQFLFLTALVALAVHISDYGWQQGIYVTIAFYATEYLIRLYKVIRSGGIQLAEFSLVTDDVYRVTIVNPKRWRFSEGQYVYFRVLTPRLFLQAHPFSVMGESADGLELLIKAKDGLTGKLLERLLLEPKHTFQDRVVIEGPYGHGTKLRSYKNLVIFAGGVGITALYAHATSKSRDHCQNLRLVWVVKSRRHLLAFSSQLEALRKLQDIADISVYVTSADMDNLEFSDEEGETLNKLCSPETLSHGRPNIELILDGYLKSSTGSVAVCACGPPTFLDTTRAAVRESILRFPEVMDYFEEGLGW